MTEFLTTFLANLLSSIILLLVARAWYVRQRDHKDGLAGHPNTTPPPGADLMAPARPRRTMWG